MARPIMFTKSLTAGSANKLATTQSASAGVPLTLTATLVIDAFNAVTNTAPGRRVVIAYTGTDTSFTIVGTNAAGATITDVVVGSSGAAQSNMDFITVSSITPVGGGLTGVTAGTNAVGSSPWASMNWDPTSVINIGVAVELVSGACNFTAQYTYDDPNNFANLPVAPPYPIPFPMGTITAQAATIDGPITFPMAALRVLINSGTGVIRTRFLQSSIG